MSKSNQNFWGDNCPQSKNVESSSSSSSSSSEAESETEEELAARGVRKGVTARGAVWESGVTLLGKAYLKAKMTTSESLADFPLLANEVAPSCPALSAQLDKEMEELIPKKQDPPKPHIGQTIMPLFYENWGLSSEEPPDYVDNENKEQNVPIVSKLRKDQSSKNIRDKEKWKPKYDDDDDNDDEPQPGPSWKMYNKKKIMKGTKSDKPGPGKPDGAQKLVNEPRRLTAQEESLQPVQGVNPMLIEHVMQSVLRNLPTATVKACRLLCHDWYAIASDFLVNNRGSFIVRTNPYNEQEVEALYRTLAADPTFGYESLSVIGFKLLSLATPTGVLMKRLCGKVSVLKLSACVVSPGLFSNFLARRAPCLEVLHMQSVGFDLTLSDKINFSWPLLLDGLQLEHMKEFKIVDEYDEDYEGVDLHKPVHGPLKIPMHRLSTAFPNLKRLIVKGDLGLGVEIDKSNMELYFTNTEYEKSNWKSTLEEFAFHNLDSTSRTSEFDPSIFRVLRATGMGKLRKIDITPFTDGVEPRKGFRWIMDSIYDFLDGIKGTVKEVRIAVYSENCPSSHLPLMPIQFQALERLSMSSGMIVSLGALPRLESFTTLEIEDYHSVGGIRNLLSRVTKYDRFGNQLPSKVLPNPFITSLKLHTLGLNEINQFGLYFPNLRKLELKLSFHNKQYFVTYAEKLDYHTLTEMFPLLEELKVRIPFNYESGLDPTDEDIIGDTGISSLKNLRVLDFHPNRKLTDAAVIRGISKLDNLEFLNLSRSQITVSSLDWFSRNLDKLPKLKTLKVESCDNITEDDCIKLSSVRRDLIVIYNSDDTEIKWCYRRNKELQHNKHTCNCDDPSLSRSRPANYKVTSDGAAVRPMGAGFW